MSKITEYFDRVDDLAGLYLTAGDLPVVALAGPYNSGKSTMVNSLLEQYVSPVDILPATTVPVVFSPGQSFSITARLANGRIKALNNAELRLLSKNGDPLAKRVLEVEIVLNHALLRRMRLVDTPGCDAAAVSDVLPARLAGADHIVYLLHQRGPGEADRKFIGRLLASAGADKLSFWINRNLRHFDGTSLTESRRVLRDICGREMPVHVTDTQNPEAVGQFCLFIRARAAETVISRVSEKLKELDRRIPELASATMKENNEASFLLRYWDVGRTAEKIIQGGRIINSLPLVTRQINNSVQDFIKPESGLHDRAAAGPDQTGAPEPALVRGRIKTLLMQAADDPALQSDGVARGLLQKLAGELDGERYLVTAAGGFSTGKTTFFNALLGENLLPAKNRPTTFTITRLCHGEKKKAVVRFASRVTIPTHFVENKDALICRHELEVLESWLTDPELRGAISALEKLNKSRSVSISPDELLSELETLKETFARIKRRAPKGGKPWKSLFKRIPLANFRGGGQADGYVVHFPDRNSIELDLNGADGRQALEQTVGSHRALQVEEIEISHPAEILRTADFLDTPGLDSVYHRHREITTHYLPVSDCFLFFLNGKHILTKPDLGTYNIISEALDSAASNSGKLFIIVNFADALNEREKERVLNYVHTGLACSTRAKPAGIYLLSALDALTGRDGRALNHLTAALKERIWSLRCAGNYSSVIRRARTALKDLAEAKTPAVPALSAPKEHLPQDMKVVMREAGTVTVRRQKNSAGIPPVKAAEYVRRLENLEREIITPGGKTNGKRQGAG